MQATVFSGGVPTGPDVKLIREVFPDDCLTENKEIPYSEIELAISILRGSSRFRTVTDAWRRAVERDTGIVIDVIPGSGFIVLSDRGKLDLSGRKLREAGRKVRRSVKIMALTDPLALTAEERKRLQHQSNICNQMRAIQQLRKPSGRKQLTEGVES